MQAGWRLGLVALAASGCARISTKVEYSDTLVSRATKVTTVEESLRYLTSAPSVVGTNVVVEVKSEETCRTKITPWYRRTTQVTRELRPDATGKAFGPATTGVTGLLLAGMGAYSVANAQSLADMSRQSDGTTSTPDDYRNLGAVLIGTGAIVGTVALIDAFRLRDEVRDGGEHAGNPEVSEDSCHRKALSNAKVVARVDRVTGFETESATNANGVARFSMLELPSNALGGHSLVLSLAIGDAIVPVRFGSAEIEALRNSLDTAPDSRISRDREAKKTATCQYLVDTVGAEHVTSDTGDRQVARLQRDWDHAKATCGDKWLPEHEQRLASFKVEVEASAKDRATLACKDAVATAREAISLDAEDTGIDAARTACDGVENGSKLIGALEEAQRRRKAEQARAEQRAASADALMARMRASDAIGVRAMLAKDPELKALLRGDAGWATMIASHWIGALERGATGKDVRAQLCASRSLIIAFSGEAEWNRLRAKAVERAGVTNGARIAKQMNAGGCS